SRHTCFSRDWSSDVCSSDLVAPRSRFDKSAEGPGETARHLIVLVKNLQGYRNLMKLTSTGFLEGFYYRPRIDKEFLASHSEGLKIGRASCREGMLVAVSVGC